jgi:hypothetical protein
VKEILRTSVYIKSERNKNAHYNVSVPRSIEKKRRKMLTGNARLKVWPLA